MKAKIVLKLPKPASRVVLFARSVVAAMSDNPLFPSPSPPLATVAQHIDELAAADAAVLCRAIGNRAVRDVKLAIVQDDLEALAGYVQPIARANPAEALSIIEAAGMSAKKPSPRNKRPFVAADGPVSGSVALVATSAGDRATYEWQSSLDGKTWNKVRQTIQARTVVTDLTPGREYFFRVLITTKDGLAVVSDVVSLLVR